MNVVKLLSDHSRKAAAKEAKSISESEEPLAIDAALSVILQSTRMFNRRASRKDDDSDLRMCLYIPGDEPLTVEQYTNYHGVSKPHGKGRIVNIRSGAVGEAARTGNAVFISPKKNEATRDFLATKGFTPEEILSMDTSRRTWAAVPFEKGAGASSVVAILYADSKLDFFWGQHAADNRRVAFIRLAFTLGNYLR